MRRMIFLILALLSVTALFGCGNSGEFVLENTGDGTPPLAADDTFTALGNAILERAAPGVFVNDALNGAQVSAFDETGNQSGTLSLKTDGSFSYTPLTGFVGSESFTYTISNTEGSSTATVTLISSGFGIFVDNTAPGGGTGTQTDPFNTLSQAAVLAQAGDVIFVDHGDGTNTGMTGGINLPAGVDLMGEGTGLILSQTIVPEGEAPTIEGPIDCGGDNTIQGLRIDGSASDLIQLTNVGNVTVTDCVLANPSSAHIQATSIFGLFSVTEVMFQNAAVPVTQSIRLDNSDSSASTVAVITDNEFSNTSGESVFSSLCRFSTQGNGSLDLTFSRNLAGGSLPNQFNNALLWNNESTTFEATLTYENNELVNGGGGLGILGVTATITGNTFTDLAEAIGIGIEDETVNITQNIFSNSEVGVSAEFESGWIFRGNRSLVSRLVDHPYRTKSITFWHRCRSVISPAANLLSFRF